MADLRLGEDPFGFSNWQPDLPPRHECDRAVSVELRQEPLPQPDLVVLESLLATGIKDHARRLLYDGRRFLGVVSVESTQRHYTRNDLRRLDAVAPTCVGLLAAARVRDDDFGGDSCAALFDGRGRLLHVSPRLGHWLDHERRARLVDLVRRHDRNPAHTLVEGREVRVTRLLQSGSSRYLVTVAPMTAPLISPAADLSSRQREVCKLASLGATVAEMASELGISGNTVRRHLARVYEVLNVRNRAELSGRMKEEGGH